MLEKIDEIYSAVLAKLTNSDVKVELAEEDEVPADVVDDVVDEAEDLSAKSLIEMLADKADGSYTITAILLDGKVIEAEVNEMPSTEELEEIEEEFSDEVTKELKVELKVEKTDIEPILLQFKNDLQAEFEANLAIEKAKYEAKLAEIGKQAGESKLKQAPDVEPKKEALTVAELRIKRILGE